MYMWEGAGIKRLAKGTKHPVKFRVRVKIMDIPAQSLLFPFMYTADSRKKNGRGDLQPIRYEAVTCAVIFTCPGSMGVGIAACVFMSAAPARTFS
mgnify:CR=1 FL=1